MAPFCWLFVADVVYHLKKKRGKNPGYTFSSFNNNCRFSDGHASNMWSYKNISTLYSKPIQHSRQTLFLYIDIFIASRICTCLHTLSMVFQSDTFRKNFVSFIPHYVWKRKIRFIFPQKFPPEWKSWEAPLKNDGNVASSTATKSPSCSVKPTNRYFLTRLPLACSKAHSFPGSLLHGNKNYINSSCTQKTVR